MATADLILVNDEQTSQNLARAIEGYSVESDEQQIRLGPIILLCLRFSVARQGQLLASAALLFRQRVLEQTVESRRWLDAAIALLKLGDP